MLASSLGMRAVGVVPDPSFIRTLDPPDALLAQGVRRVKVTTLRDKVQIDDHLMAEWRSCARVDKTSMTHTLNRVIRVGVAASGRPREECEWVEEMPVRMWRPRMEIDKAPALEIGLDDEEVVCKMSWRQ